MCTKTHLNSEEAMEDLFRHGSEGGADKSSALSNKVETFSNLRFRL